MGEAAALVTDVFAPEFIDINFGCPVKKVVKRNGGSGCLKDLNLVQDVIRAVARSTSLPVTCKIRSGWNEEMRDPVTIALRCQDAGVRAHRAASAHAHADVHRAARAGRRSPPSSTRSTSRCSATATSRRRTTRSACGAQTKCAGIMIARGSFGQPWIFDQTRDLLEGRPMRADPPVEERFAVALDHARMANDYEPDRRGAAIEFRKHLGWYVKGLPGSADLRKRLHAVDVARRSRRDLRGLSRGRATAIARRRRRRDETAGDRRGMRRERVRDLLQQVADGSLDAAAALDALAFEPAESLGFATIDHHRALRQGFPEVVYGAGKTPAQIVEIATRIAARGDGAARHAAVATTRPTALAAVASRTSSSTRSRARAYLPGRGAAGAGDGNRRRRHRRHERPARRRGGGGDARARWATAWRASPTSASRAFIVCSLAATSSTAAAVVIVIAGMDGALPSVVGGLVSAPVIAVPTSVGYGASFQGTRAAAHHAEQLRGRCDGGEHRQRVRSGSCGIANHAPVSGRRETVHRRPRRPWRSARLRRVVGRCAGNREAGAAAGVGAARDAIRRAAVVVARQR